MKKSLLIALVGFMFIGFASCSCGSKEYQDAKEANNKLEKALNDAKDCDALRKAWVDALDAKTPKYNEDEMMTDDEEAKIKESNKKLDDLYKKRQEELKCN